MEWHYRETGKLAEHQNLADSGSHISRRRLLNKLAKRCGFKTKLADCLYNVTPKILPGTGARVDVIWHDFRQQLVSILTNPRLTDQDFLHINQDPFAPPEDGNYIGDINTGLSYNQTYHKLIKDPERQMLVPIILYIDGAVTGQFDKLEVEALQFAVGILNREVRIYAFTATLGRHGSHGLGGTTLSRGTKH